MEAVEAGPGPSHIPGALISPQPGETLRAAGAVSLGTFTLNSNLQTCNQIIISSDNYKCGWYPPPSGISVHSAMNPGLVATSSVENSMVTLLQLLMGPGTEVPQNFSLEDPLEIFT